jgi:dTDP-4-amino-4,6-dideoxygalactose transaminase
VTRVPFADLAREYEPLGAAYHAAVERVLRRGWYVLGEELREFERAFAAWLDVRHCVGCGSGTDAITLALKALGIGRGDDVVTVANTGAMTVVGIENSGARARLVDADPETLMLDVRKLEAALTPATRAVVPVHLYGSAVDMGGLLAVARRHHLAVVEDCAQSHGSEWQGRKTGTFGDIGAFSFYPSKNLGALGDGGACVTNDPQLAERLRQLRNYGQASHYVHVARGLNSRLDELQAALLGAKLPHVASMNERRRAIAHRYSERLRGVAGLRLPRVGDDVHAVYHLFVVLHPERDALQQHLAAAEVQTSIHYPVPVHLQPVYHDLGYAQGAFPVAERAGQQLLSLPLHPWMEDREVEQVINAVRDFAAAGSPTQRASG